MSKQEEKLLTETELELMNILWSLTKGTVRDVMEFLPKDRDLAYTSVSTILRILEKKGVIKSEKFGKSHIYQPILTQNEYRKNGLSHLVNNVFSSTPTELVKTLLDTQDLNNNDLIEIKKLINLRIKK